MPASVNGMERFMQQLLRGTSLSLSRWPNEIAENESERIFRCFHSVFLAKKEGITSPESSSSRSFWRIYAVFDPLCFKTQGERTREHPRMNLLVSGNEIIRIHSFPFPFSLGPSFSSAKNCIQICQIFHLPARR